MCLVRSLPGALAPAGALCTRCGIVVRLGCMVLHVATFIHMLLSHAALLCCFLPHCHCTLLYTSHCWSSSLLLNSSKQVKPPGLSAEACKEETRSATSLVRVDFLSTLALVHLAFCTYLTQVGSGYVPSTGWSTYPSPFPLTLSGRQAGIPTTVCQMPLCPKHAKVE